MSSSDDSSSDEEIMRKIKYITRYVRLSKPVFKSESKSWSSTTNFNTNFQGGQFSKSDTVR